MAPDTDHAHQKTLTTLLMVGGVVVVFYVASDVILPLALATLLTFLLTPPIAWLERLRLGRVPAVLIVTGVTFAILAGIGWIVANQLIALSEELPGLVANVQTRFAAVQQMFGGAGEGTLIDKLKNALTGRPAETTTGEGPTPVTIVESSGTAALGFLSDWLGPLLAPLGTAAIVLVFVIFMLIQREDLRDRLIRLSGTGHLLTTTQALDEAARRVSKYLLMLVIINGSYGIIVALALWLIGLPSPFLWGLLAGILRFIPYVGPWIAASLPIALSVASSPDGWMIPLLTVGLFVLMELFSNNVMEPWLYGTSLGISVIGIIVMATFWTWLWGPLGLVLSMPLTVCLVVLGRYVPRLAWLNVLLGDAPALALRERYYQRLLALDYHEAGAVVAEGLKHGSIEQLYTEVLMPALSLAERDRNAGTLVDSQRQFFYQTIRETIEDLGAKVRPPEETTPPGEKPKAVRVWCVPAEDDADELAGAMLAQIFAAHGFSAEAVPAGDVDAKLLDQLTESANDAIVISAVAPGGVIYARRLCRQLRPERKHLLIITGLWNASGPLGQAEQRLKADGADAVVTTLYDALQLIEPRTEADSPPDQKLLEPGRFAPASSAPE